MAKYNAVPKPAAQPKPPESYVTIPERNVLGWPHPEIALNDERFYPGDTYLLPTDMAEELDRILAQYQTSMIKLLQGRVDIDALIALHRAKTRRGRGEPAPQASDLRGEPKDGRELDMLAARLGEDHVITEQKVSA